jgi:hypothetical protein
MQDSGCRNVTLLLNGNTHSPSSGCSPCMASRVQAGGDRSRGRMASDLIYLEPRRLNRSCRRRRRHRPVLCVPQPHWRQLHVVNYWSRNHNSGGSDGSDGSDSSRDERASEREAHGESDVVRVLGQERVPTPPRRACDLRTMQALEHPDKSQPRSPSSQQQHGERGGWVAGWVVVSDPLGLSPWAETPQVVC